MTIFWTIVGYLFMVAANGLSLFLMFVPGNMKDKMIVNAIASAPVAVFTILGSIALGLLGLPWVGWIYIPIMFIVINIAPLFFSR